MIRFGFLVLLLQISAGCATVTAYEREYLADPTMQPTPDPLEAYSYRQLHRSREAASGGDSNSAGGGCGCTN